MTTLRCTRALLIPCALTTLLIPAVAVAAQPDAGVGAATSAAGRSFASAFFVSRNADGSLEILGSLVIWFLLVLSAGSIGMIGYMAMSNQRKSILPDGLQDELRTHLANGRYKEALALTEREGSYFSQVVHAGLRNAGHGFGAILRSLEQTADELTTIRFRRIELLNVLGQVSPMIGLFGTVYGMILAFQAIVVSGGNADPVLLAGGIGTALTTTFWGLIVAIPALGGYALIRNRIDEVTSEATLAAEDLLNQFRPRASGDGARAGGAKNAPARRASGASTGDAGAAPGAGS